MAAQTGRELILKLGDGGSPETFAEVSGQLTGTVSFSEQTVDVTTKDDSGIAQVLAGKVLGQYTASITGVFKDTADITTISGYAEAGTHNNYQIVIPGSTAPITYEGAFRVESFEFSGENTGAVQYSLNLISDGTVTKS